MADIPSRPSPEILEKLRQLKEEAEKRIAQQDPKDANTLAWQQSNAFKRIYPKANGGQIDMDRMRLELMGKGGKVPKVLYHGTGSDIKEFRPNTFFSDDPKIAGMYARSQHRAVEGSGPNIMPVHAKMENPFVFDEAEARRQGKSFGQMIAPHAPTKHRHAEALRILKERGHDGVILQNFDDIGGRQNQYIVFDPRKVKSAIGNRGTYDINDPDITKKNGGITHAHHLDIEERPL